MLSWLGMADPEPEKDAAAPEPVRVSEGKATVQIPAGNRVFYNKAQVNNRDLSVALLRVFADVRRAEWREGAYPAAKRASRMAASDAKAKHLAGHPGDEAEAEKLGKVALDDVLARPAPGMAVMEAMAASGLRSLRYAREVHGVGAIVATDLAEAAADSMTTNAELSGVSVRSGGRRTAVEPPEPAAEPTLDPRMADCRVTMLANQNAFDIVDLDPYGSPAPFLDAAVQSVLDGGLLCVTATDMAVLCGNNAEVCFTKYGSYPIHRRSVCHEAAIRILLHSIAAHAARYKRIIEPLLSVSMDFYIRVFVRVRTSAAGVKLNPSRLSYVYYSASCDSIHLVPVGRVVDRSGRKVVEGSDGDGNGAEVAAGDEAGAGGDDEVGVGSRGGAGRGAAKYAPGVAGPSVCEETGSKMLVGGPIWSGPIHDTAFVRKVLSELKRDARQFAAYAKLHGLLTVILEELPDQPLHVDTHAMSTFLKCTPPAATTFRSALVNAGYSVSSTHSNQLAIKTNAPWSVCWDVMRAWVVEHPLGRPHPEDSAPARLLAREPKTDVSFFRRMDAVSDAKKKNVTRYPHNPSNWGPQRAAPRGEAKRAADAAAGDGGAAKAARVE